MVLTISGLGIYQCFPFGMRFSKALKNQVLANMAVGPMIAKTCCSQSGATAIAYLAAHKVWRISSNNN